ncbi:Crp/Fnr family transcriptional regulator [Gluconacetobacter entanii]|uniref:Transcriptional regulator n=1 Tax=Gluconacetobacter entanii TaxID=108528 RepID=A0A318PQH1_9PROT|nr:Crp/Fnr family transcriptional regulator [Gluconacetobacter entanii]PYD62710.1 transcriptional regulator [Gluconacetobacter entanii]
MPTTPFTSPAAHNGIPSFPPMPDRLCRDIVDFCNKHHTTCRETRFRPRNVIIEESATAHYTFLVRHGTVKLSKSMPNGRSQIVGFVGSGHILGTSSQELYMFQAEAISDVTVNRLSRTMFEYILVNAPDILSRLLEETTSQLVMIQERLLALGRKTAREKLAGFLLREATRNNGSDIHLPFSLQMSRADIADYLGLSTETVSRLMSVFHQEKMIHRSRQVIQLLAPSRLAAMSCTIL